MFFRKAWAFLKRDLLESMSYKTQWALDAASMIAQMFIFFYVARLLNGQDIPALRQYTGGYFPYVLTGIALAGFQSAALESFAKAIYREQGSGTLEAVLLSPTSLQSVVLYSLFWTSLFTCARLAVFLAAGFFLFHAPLGQINLFGAVTTLLLTLSALSGLGMISAGLVLLLKRADPLGTALSGLSRLISGVYFPAALLPAWIKGLSLFLPLTYGLEALRKSVLQGSGWALFGREWLVLMIFTAVLLPAGLAFFSWTLKKAKKDGSLAFA